METILLGGIYERTFVKSTISCVFGENECVCDIQTSVRKYLGGIFTNARLYITMPYCGSLHRSMYMYEGCSTLVSPNPN